MEKEIIKHKRNHTQNLFEKKGSCRNHTKNAIAQKNKNNKKEWVIQKLY